MRFGVCGDTAMAAVAAKVGFDYAEGSVGAFLKPRDPEAAFLETLTAARGAALPYPCVNCFVPADLKITGPAVDAAALETYVRVTCARARQAGVSIIVFGSGGARAVPEGFDRAGAYAQLIRFAAMTGPIAAAAGVTLAVEPLNTAECNILNSVGECARLVREVAHPAIRLLADAYHMLKDGDSLEDLAANGDILAHVHVATIPTRRAPGAEPCDLAPFFSALARAGYGGGVSIEGNLPDPATDLPRALALMRALTGMDRM